MEDTFVYDRNIYAFSLLSVIFGLCFIRQHLMAYKPNCQENLNALGLETSNVWLATCGSVVKLSDGMSFQSRQFPKEVLGLIPVKCMWFNFKLGLNHLQRWHEVSNLLFVFCLLCDWRHLLKRFLWLVIWASDLELPSSQQTRVTLWPQRKVAKERGYICCWAGQVSLVRKTW